MNVYNFYLALMSIRFKHLLHYNVHIVTYSCIIIIIFPQIIFMQSYYDVVGFQAKHQNKAL